MRILGHEDGHYGVIFEQEKSHYAEFGSIPWLEFFRYLGLIFVFNTEDVDGKRQNCSTNANLEKFF